MAGQGDSRSIDFTRDVRPILSETCFQCHGPDAATREAELRLDDARSSVEVLQPLADGRIPLLDRITSDDPDHRMPPPDALKQLSPEQIETLTAWVKQGAKYEMHWSFQPPRRPALPDSASDPWCSNPIDAFVLDKLMENGLHPASAAPPEKLLRRLCFDLTGLPATPQQAEEFAQRVDRLGLERAVEQEIAGLMASRSYGEHMALPWLEAARYADTDGYQNDRYRYQHAWRDWVIRAFDQKMPYDQFVVEQLAGDLLPEPTLWQQVATGFGRNHRINSEDGSIPEEWLAENVVDRVDTFGTVFLGLTIGCARCHDHKYDPISQREYYQLFAYFNNIAEHGVGPNNGNSPPFIELPDSWPLLGDKEDRFQTPEPVKLRNAREEAGNGLQRPQAGAPNTVMVMHELAQPRETFLLVRGRYDMPDTSQRLWPSVPQALRSEAVLPASSDATVEYGRDRLALARWLVDGKNPLTARVAVNRIWQQIFGMGIVQTSENFGSQGTLPTHPELLDWLAVELVENGWNLQHIQRLILQSSTYQQTSSVPAGRYAQDPDNVWLARGPRGRLPGFAIRDQALLISGLLVQRTGGASAKPYMPESIWSAISNNDYEQDQGENLFRRSLYTYWRRTIPPPTMMNFNAASREVCIVRTENTNTPLQALTLLNNKTFVEAARAMAERVLKQPACEREQQVRFLFRLATSREPAPDELAVLLSAHQQFQLELSGSKEGAEEIVSVGESPRDSTLDSTQHAALSLLASLLLNLDETISKE